MKYRADILALYGDLFEETHAAFEKRAGIFGRLLGRGGAPTTKAIGRTIGQQTERELAEGTLRQLQAHPTMGRHFANVTPEAFQQQYSKTLRPGVGRVNAPMPAAGTPEHAALMQQHGIGAAAAPAEAAATSPKSKVGLGTVAALGIPAAGLGGYMLGRPNTDEIEQQRVRSRNIAFGAGAATGLAAPHIIRGLGSLANSVGGQGLYPDMAPGMGY